MMLQARRHKHGPGAAVLRMKTAGMLFAFSVLVGFVSSARGQTAQEPTSTVPVIHAKSEEVSLDLVVHDKKNRPVIDLRPDEIEVTDNGTEVKLKSLRLVSDRPDSEHLITLLFDRPDPATTKRDREIAARILKIIPEKGFSFAVLQVEGRLRLEQDFTSDRNALRQAVNVVTEAERSGEESPFDLPEKNLIAMVRKGAGPLGKTISPADRDVAQSLFSALDESGRTVQDQHAEPSLAGLLALVQSQQRLPQRKAIIFFTRSRQMDSRAGEMLKTIVGAANRTGVSIYAIDLNAMDPEVHSEFAATISLVGTVPGTVQGATSRQPLPAPSQVFTDNYRAAGSPRDHAAENDPIRNLANGTGGSYIRGEDDLRRPLERMVQDMTTYYQASYVPSIQEYDGGFRAVSVKPLRAGLTVRTSAGYFALPPDATAGTRPFELPLLKILGGPQLPTDLAFHAAVLRMGEMPQKDENTLAIEAPLSDAEIREDASTKLYSLHLSIVAQIKGKTGEVLKKFSEDIPRRGALEEIEKTRSESVAFQLHFTAPPGGYILEAAVLDRNSGKAGAQRVPFEIPGGSGGPSVSDMVLARRIEPFNDQTDPLEPLAQGNAKVTPNLSGQATPSAREVSLSFITHTDPQASQAAELDLQILRNGEVVAHTPMAAGKTGGTGAATHLVSFPVNSLQEGIYEVEATLSQGGKTAESTLSFTLAGSERRGEKTEVLESDLAVPAMNSRPTGLRETGPLAVTFPSVPIRPPPPDELKSILADARQRALGYSASLPNFMCVEVTNRLVDARGNGQWKRNDRFSEMLTYRDQTEHRTMLEVNGLKTNTERGDLTGWLSHGEFGSVFRAVFDPSAKADFQWKGAGALGDGTVQIFDYRVARENSAFDLKMGNMRQVVVGFHGQVFIDSATRNVRRITMTADDLPKELPVHATSVSVDYDYVAINNHDYLVPIGAQVSLRQGSRAEILNEIAFHDYRRFGSTVKMLDFAAGEKP